MKRLFVILIVFLLCLIAQPVLAENSPVNEKSMATLSPEENLAVLKKKTEENPKDFDAHFAYAKAAEELSLFKEAEETYLHMIYLDPTLDRVKLDLALLYTRTGKPGKAKKLYEEVLANNPPEGVKENINMVMKMVDDALKTHKFGGSVAFGYNQDSNANSSSSSGSITFFDFSIPLEADSRAKKDGQVYGSFSLNHTYRFDLPEDGNKAARWLSSASVYRTEQAELDDLDLQVLALRTGPELDLIEQRTKLGLAANYNYIKLDSFEYLNIASGEVYGQKGMGNSFSVNWNFSYENRHFVNSPLVQTYSDRTGYAFQYKVGAAYAITPKDIINGSITKRREQAKKKYLSYNQMAITGSYIHSFDEGYFLNLNAGYRPSDYDDVDPFVSLTKTREDRERTGGINIGKQFKNGITLMVGYEYKNSRSNIENFDFNNHRFSSGVSYSF